MIVRPERASDFPAIAALVQEAFDSPVEPKLVADLRASPAYVPELALVAADPDPIGHVMFTLAEIGDGTAILILAPLAVRPDRQRQGVGTALAEEGLRRARDRDEPIAIVVGDPAYYSRFGFRLAADLGLEPPEGTPEHAFQALPLPAYDGTVRGPVRYPPAFDGL